MPQKLAPLALFIFLWSILFISMTNLLPDNYTKYYTEVQSQKPTPSGLDYVIIIFSLEKEEFPTGGYVH